MPILIVRGDVETTILQTIRARFFFSRVLSCPVERFCFVYGVYVLPRVMAVKRNIILLLNTEYKHNRLIVI